jgi:hypothetical protein
MKIKISPGAKFTTGDHPYVCSFSPSLRETINKAKEGFPNIIDAIKFQIDSLVEFFAKSKELCDSLKVYSPEARIMRQVDLRFNENDPVFLKCFVSWDWDNKCWMVFCEDGEDNHWEKGVVKEGSN